MRCEMFILATERESPIEEHIFEDVSVNVPWREGDVLLPDNMLTANGRRPYEGERQVLVAMGEMISEP